MTSQALVDLLSGIEEVRSLRAHVQQRANVSRSRRPGWEAARIANRRACVVLLCSHYERFIYGINEEATDFLNSIGLPSEKLPEKLRLLQTRQAIDEIALQQWDTRSTKLLAFASNYAAMWTPGQPVTRLEASFTLAGMKSPKINDVLRYFDAFGVPDILGTITRTEHNRRRLARSIQSLVDSRNGIAHGDATVQPQGIEVTQYCNAILDFAVRVDRVFGKELSRRAASATPW